MNYEPNNGNVNWFRRVERIQPQWTTADNGDGTYTHTATIADMKANGSPSVASLALTVNDYDHRLHRQS